VGAALPDPPFEFMTASGPTGIDVTIMQRIASQLGRTWQLVRYTGADFNGIFAGLDEGTYDCVASGTTITPDRERIADFCPPYAVSGPPGPGYTPMTRSKGRLMTSRPAVVTPS
jgi:polar amino acid transport system substrate-binding protein